MNSLVLLLYSFMVLLCSPAAIVVFVCKYGARKTLKGLGERLSLGFPGPDAFPGEGPKFWFHAASVGEVKAVEALLRQVPRRFVGARCLLTTTTVSGKELADSLGLGLQVRLAPLDAPPCVNRLLKSFRPQALVLVETEIWPAWLAAARVFGIPAVVLNARISDRSFPLYKLLRWFWRPLMSGVFAGAQSESHAGRWKTLGVPETQVLATGNLKFDVPMPDTGKKSALTGYYGFSKDDFVLAAGSTHPGEEDVLFGCMAALKAGDGRFKMILAPRHTERARALAAAASRRGFSIGFDSDPVKAPCEILVLDTVGKLAEAYGAASLAFVGGSLIDRGGQNPLEPARWAVPVLFGPSMRNFSEIAESLLAKGGAFRIKDGSDLEKWILMFKSDKAAAEKAGLAAREAARSETGSVSKNLDFLAQCLRRNGPAS